MKKLVIILLFVSQVAFSANYYVSTTGSDSAEGTNSAPFATWLRGFQALTSAGDTLFIRGGIYDLSAHLYLTSGVGGQGTKISPIVVMNYNNEYPILDCDNLDATSGWDISGKTYWKFIGLHVTHVYQDGQSIKVNAIGVSNCNNVHFINCSVHDNGGSGFIFNSNDTIYIRNVDSYNNCDSLGESGGELGGKADGFQMYCYDCTTDTDGWQMTYFDNCRAWNNSDDGWDFLRNTKGVVDSCWAIYNGYPLDGSGQGMKAGLAQYDPPNNQYIFTNNVAIYNKNGGFRDNSNSMPAHIDSRWYNNIAAFNASRGFASSIGTGEMATNIWRNNISYQNTNGDWWEDLSVLTQDHNSWDTPPGVTITNADFISVDTTGITASRQTNGNLPSNDCYNNFMRLVTSSDLINVGVDVGLPYNGSAPDLGAFEYNDLRFKVIVLPDLQNMARPERSHIYYSMLKWIEDNRIDSNIVFVSSVGDVIAGYDLVVQWEVADLAFGYLDAIDLPYGISPGNHDYGDDGAGDAATFNYYFGPSRFTGKSWYEGNYPEDENLNSVQFFEASGMEFMAIHMELEPSVDAIDWADSVLKANPTKRAIITSHFLLYVDGSRRSVSLYNSLSDNPNLFLMLCGHVHAANRRQDVYGSTVIHTLLSNYQDTINGGNGYLRIMDFSPAKDSIYVTTYSPYADEYLTDSRNQFQIYYDMEEDSDDQDETDILTFTLPTQTGAATINTTNHTIAIEVNYLATVTNLTPYIAVSYGATISPASMTARDFTTPQTYTVTALDGTTTQVWTVTVTQEEEPYVPPEVDTSRMIKFNGGHLRKFRQ